MLYKVKTLRGYKLHSRDGDIGKVDEFYFDDRHWTIRYLGADTGNWLTGRQVLISPYALIAVNKEEQYIVVDLTKKQIEDSPPLDSDKPVSRQYEESYYRYYGWPMYWGGPNMWGPYPNIVRDREKWRESIQGKAAITSKPQTARLATSRILSSTTRRGRFVISSSKHIIGGREKRSWFLRSGSSALAGTI
jgi:hypothetical protein